LGYEFNILLKRINTLFNVTDDINIRNINSNNTKELTQILLLQNQKQKTNLTSQTSRQQRVKRKKGFLTLQLKLENELKTHSFKVK
jgi:predicted RNA-binding protein with RPS1 domain